MLVSLAQKGPGIFARGWKYNLYTAVTTMYEKKSEAVSAATFGYDTPSATPMVAMAAAEESN